MTRELSKSCPCIGCKPPDRTTTCHDTCEKFKEWKTKYDDLVKQGRKAIYNYFVNRNKNERRDG